MSPDAVTEARPEGLPAQFASVEMLAESWRHGQRKITAQAQELAGLRRQLAQLEGLLVQAAQDRALLQRAAALYGQLARNDGMLEGEQFAYDAEQVPPVEADEEGEEPWTTPKRSLLSRIRRA